MSGDNSSKFREIDWTFVHGVNRCLKVFLKEDPERAINEEEMSVLQFLGFLVDPKRFEGVDRDKYQIIPHAETIINYILAHKDIIKHYSLDLWLFLESLCTKRTTAHIIEAANQFPYPKDGEEEGDDDEDLTQPPPSPPSAQDPDATVPAVEMNDKFYNSEYDRYHYRGEYSDTEPDPTPLFAKTIAMVSDTILAEVQDFKKKAKKDVSVGDDDDDDDDDDDEAVEVNTRPREPIVVVAAEELADDESEEEEEEEESEEEETDEDIKQKIAEICSNFHLEGELHHHYAPDSKGYDRCTKSDFSLFFVPNKKPKH